MDDAELAKTQWISLSEVLRLIGTDYQAREQLSYLKTRGLSDLRPVQLYINLERKLVTTLEDGYSQRCIEKILTPQTDWDPSDSDDPSSASVEFHVLAFLKWLDDKRVEFPRESLQIWKRDTLPFLKAQGLLVQSSKAPVKSAPSQTVVQLQSAGVVKESHLAAMTGYSVSALETMRRRGDVVKDKHWFKTPKGGISWDVEEFEQWQMNANLQPDTQVSKSNKERSGSESHSEEDGSGNRPIRRRRRKG